MTEVLNTSGEVTPSVAPEGHDAAMIAKVDAVAADLPKDPAAAPEKLLGKFDSAEDLAKAYTELEKKLGAPKEEAPKAEALDEDSASKLILDAGVDIDSIADHYTANGELTEEHYATLEAAGISRDYVNQYIDGAEASASQIRDEIFTEVGGEEAFGQMSAWAVANLTPTELQRYNAQVDSGDMDNVRAAVMGLAYRYQRDNGRDPQLLNGGQASLAGFESVAQLTAAMKDPRYETDSAYRREIEQKLSRSNIM